MKNAFLLALPFALIACDSGGGSSSSSGSPIESQGPPSNPEDATGENTASPTDSGADESLEATYRNEIFSLINDERTAVGLSALTSDSSLDSLADGHNEYMEEQAALSPGSGILISHDNFQERANSAFDQGFVSFGENVGAVRGYSASQVAAAIVEGWNESPPHRTSIEGDFTHTGVGVLVDTTDGTIYATQLFAR